MKHPRAKSITAYAIATGDRIDVARIEPGTPEGRREAIRQINRPAGERVITVAISEVRK